MTSVVSWIFLLLVIVAGAFHLAPHVAGRGNYFAVTVCSIGGGTLCQHPEYVTIAAAAAGALWIILWSLDR